MQKHHMNSFYLVDKIEQHTVIKDKILSLIQDLPLEPPRPVDWDHTADRVSKVDWRDSENMDRSWAKLFYPILRRKLQQMMHNVGYTGVNIGNLWFQQYIKSDFHKWHCHGETWVGIYYLELDTASPITEIRDPLSRENIITPDVVEGDIILFPSYVIHRAPEIHSDIRKTIISFNFTCGNID